MPFNIEDQQQLPLVLPTPQSGVLRPLFQPHHCLLYSYLPPIPIFKQPPKIFHPFGVNFLTLLFVFSYVLVNHPSFLSICKAHNADTVNLIRNLRLLLGFAAVNYKGVPMYQVLLNCIIFLNLSKRHIQQTNILIFIMLISHGLNKKHVSQFFWEVLVGIYRRRKITCLRVKNLYRGFYPVHSARCPLWNDLLYTEVLGNLWRFSSERWVPHQLKHCSSVLQPSNSTTLPLSVVTLTVFSWRYFQEAYSVSPQNEIIPQHCTLWFHQFLDFCLSSTSTSLLLEVVEVLPIFPV